LENAELRGFPSISSSEPHTKKSSTEAASNTVSYSSIFHHISVNGISRFAIWISATLLQLRVKRKSGLIVIGIVASECVVFE
jgi:hypothetical protein